jgi:UDP-N-acetyl-D-mannosaminuronate dehydrogenase
MKTKSSVVIVGMGEVGIPLHAILSTIYSCVPVDIEPVPPGDHCSVLHICYPFQIGDFVGTTLSYIDKYRPQLTIINSSIPPGTTRSIQRSSAAAVAFSPVRGKHAKMQQDMLLYKKFVAGCDSRSTELAERHFKDAGFKTATFQSPEIAELSKLLETTWLGILVGWAQEVERFGVLYGGSYEEINSFIEEITFLPSHIFPGVIGGHCVMQNIDLLKQCVQSDFLNAVVNSNKLKRERASQKELTCSKLA